MLYSPSGCSLFLTAKDADISNKNPEVTSLRPVRGSEDKPYMHSFFPLFIFCLNDQEWWGTTMIMPFFIYFFSTLHRFNWSLSEAGRKKTREQRSASDIFWDKMIKSKRKTYIIDKDMVQVPFGQLCTHDDLMCSLWQAQPISWPRCQTFPIKPVIIHVA